MNTNDIKVGDILAGTWGYSMVIPCFYKVTKVTPTGCKVVQLKSVMVRSTDGGYNQQGYEMPTKENESRDGKEVLARYIEKYGEYKVGSSRDYTARYIKKWDGQPIWADYCD